jgi:hypothetical protein
VLNIYATAGGGRSAETSYTWMSASNYKCREMADFGHLKGEVATVANDLRADLEECLLEGH